MSGATVKGGVATVRGSASKLSGAQVASMASSARSTSPAGIAVAAIPQVLSAQQTVLQKIGSYAKEHPVASALGTLALGGVAGYAISAYNNRNTSTTRRSKRISYTNTKALKRAAKRLAGFNDLSKKVNSELRRLTKVPQPRKARGTLNAYEIQLASALMNR